MSEANGVAAAGLDRFRTIGFGKIDAGAEDSGAARDHAFGIVYHQGAAGDRGQWKML